MKLEYYCVSEQVILVNLAADSYLYLSYHNYYSKVTTNTRSTYSIGILTTKTKTKKEQKQKQQQQYHHYHQQQQLNFA